MRAVLALVLLGLVASSMAQPGNLCWELNANEMTPNPTDDDIRAGLTQLVLGVFTAANVSNGPLYKFFDGTANGVNYFVGGTAQSNLVTHLVTYFYGLFGCPNFQSYTDATNKDFAAINANMFAAHTNLGIKVSDFVTFNDVVMSFVELNPMANETAKAAIRGLLDGTQTDVVQRDSYCDKYSDALEVTNSFLLDKVINETVALLVGDTASTKKFFDGTVGGVNYLTNTGALTALKAKLNSFFGTALGCTDPGYKTDMAYSPFPPGAGSTYETLHLALGITKAEFDFFNDQVIAVLTSNGVVSADTTAIRGVLDSLESVTVAPTPQAPTSTPTAPTSTPTTPTNTPSNLGCALDTASCTVDLAGCTIGILLSGKTICGCQGEYRDCIIKSGATYADGVACWVDSFQAACNALNCGNACNSGFSVSVNFFVVISSIVMAILALYH